MKTTLSIENTVPFACLVVAALATAPNFGFAQQTSQDQALEEVEEIVKVEVAVTSRLVNGPSERVAQTQVFELRRTVDIADLDLQRAADVEELDRRIENTAKEACEMLYEKRPSPPWQADRQQCISDAIKSTDQELEAIFAAIK
jgi:UrcA family protein